MFRKIAGFFYEDMGIKYLSGAFMRYVAMHGLFSVGFSLSSIFIGTFLFKLDSSFHFVAKYYLLLHIFEFIASIAVLKLLRVMKPTNVSRIGLVLYTMTYLLLVVLRENAGNYILLIAFCGGVGSSTYWMPYHNYAIDYTTIENRQYGISLHGIMGQLVGLIAPALAGIVISGMVGNDGYILIFAVTAVAMFASMLVAGKLPSTPIGGERKIVTEYIKKVVAKYKFMRIFWLAEVFYGVAQGAFGYYLNILVFSMTNDEAVLGYVSSVKAIACMVIFYLIRRTVSRRSKMAQLVFPSIAVVIWTSSLFLWSNVVSVLIFMVGHAALVNLAENGTRFVMYDITVKLREEGVDNNYALIAFRENGLNMGRCLGLVIALIMPAPQADNAALMLLVLISFMLPAAFAFYAADNAVTPGGVRLFRR